ncbi:hypothetical protein M8818_003574 [Zalaria obscura]|uniref:Uncharacterized protein n=1 Tax=Zalaria obscura TaxID=2024903 RepID=A0ACC3SGJ8_9PEZI
MSNVTRPQKPRRSARPCDACRTRKTRCILQPGSQHCIVCYTRATECTFDKVPPRKRASLRTPVHDHREADLQGTRAASIDVTEPEVAILPPLQDRSPHPGPPLSETQTGPKVRSTMAETLPRPYEDSLGLDPNRFSELYGLTSDMEPILMACSSSMS